jgi:hypothetical protein
MIDLGKIFLIASSIIFTTSVFTVEVGKTDKDASNFFETYQNQELFFEPLKAKEFEYICEEPIDDIDCRKHNVGYLDSPVSSKFTISNILYKNKIPFFELTFQEKKYYILSKRLINGLNLTNFYTDDLSLINNDFSYESEISTMRYFLEGTFKLCNGKIKKYSCDTEFTEIRDFNVLVVNSIEVNNRNIVKVLVEKENTEFWIEEYFLNKLGKKIK